MEFHDIFETYQTALDWAQSNCYSKIVELSSHANQNKLSSALRKTIENDTGFNTY